MNLSHQELGSIRRHFECFISTRIREVKYSHIGVLVHEREIQISGCWEIIPGKKLGYWRKLKRRNICYNDVFCAHIIRDLHGIRGRSRILVETSSSNDQIGVKKSPV